MDLTLYLDRIHYPRKPHQDRWDLARLHRQHLLNIPFENLDIHLGRPIRLDDESLFNKLVLCRRGGFCYEMNGLFRRVLEALGIEVELLACGVYSAEQQAYGPAHTHLALLAYYQNEQWLVDVGFGRSFAEPLRLVEGLVQRQEDIDYQLVKQPDGGWLLQRDVTGEAYEPMYRFRLEPQRFEDFFEMCRYHQTSPDSPFTQQRLISQVKPTGRITLTEDKLKLTEGRREREEMVEEEGKFNQFLQQYFDLAWDQL